MLRVLALRDKSLVTSGTYERYFEHQGKRYHHVLDPFTGFPADRGLLAVTVLSDSSLWGDALSTACLLLGAERGMALIDAVPEAEALFVLADGTVQTTAGFPEA
jgi:thiamine biosynthesis lipoprotein